MRLRKQSLRSIVLIIMIGVFSQCKSAKKLETKAPTTIGKAYYQKWIAGVQGGGSGINIFIPVSDTKIALDSVYFRNTGVKLELDGSMSNTYVGRLKTALNDKQEPALNTVEVTKKEQAPITLPFALEENACIVSYMDGSQRKYYKIENLIEKPMIPFPSAPDNQH